MDFSHPSTINFNLRNKILKHQGSSFICSRERQGKYIVPTLRDAITLSRNEDKEALDTVLITKYIIGFGACQGVL